MEKTCFKCGSTKPIEDFYAHPRMRDGHLNKCKECTRVDSSMRDPEKLKAYEAIRSKTPKRRALALKVQRSIRERYPEKSTAHNKLSRAIKKGLVKRLAFCEICQSQQHVHAHHDDYSKPLEVRWLCSSCHRKHHAANRLPF